MMDFCRFCGREIEWKDNIAWRYFGIICGSCFMPYAAYVLENMEDLEVNVKASQSTQWIMGEA